MKIDFSKTFVFEGAEYDGIDVPLEGMTGKDFADVKRGWSKEGGFAVVPAADSEFCIRVAARLAKLPLEFFEALPANEYIRTATTVSNFLMS